MTNREKALELWTGRLATMESKPEFDKDESAKDEIRRYYGHGKPWSDEQIIAHITGMIENIKEGPDWDEHGYPIDKDGNRIPS